MAALGVVSRKGRAGCGARPGDPQQRRAGGQPIASDDGHYKRRYTPPTMPKFEKSPPELVARFHAVASRHPAAQLRPMFGYPALFVGGNYACGLFAERWVVRLAPADLTDALGLPGAAAFSPMPGRAMAGWASLPQDVVADDERLDVWVSRAIAFAASLPPKG